MPHRAQIQDHCSEGNKQVTGVPAATAGCFSTPVPTESGTCPSGGVASTITFLGIYADEAPGICTAGVEVSGANSAPIQANDCNAYANACTCAFDAAANGYAYVWPDGGRAGVVVNGRNNAIFDIFSIDVAIYDDEGSCSGTLLFGELPEITITG